MLLSIILKDEKSEGLHMIYNIPSQRSLDFLPNRISKKTLPGRIFKGAFKYYVSGGSGPKC